VCAEMKKTIGTSKELSKLLSVETNRLKENVKFVNTLFEWSSADPIWDKTKIFSVRFSINPTRRGDDYMGALAITDPNGDQAFIEYSGSWKFASPGEGVTWISENKGTLTGGTGKFKGIRGVYTSKGKGFGRKYLGSEWEIEYEIALTNN
jgi:hypothetical protein